MQDECILVIYKFIKTLLKNLSVGKMKELQKQRWMEDGEKTKGGI